MDTPLIRERELEFLLWDWLRAHELLGGERFGALDRETLDAVLALCEQVAAESFLPHYKEADHIEPHLDADGQVHILPAIGAALRQYAKLGLFGAGFPEQLGGMNLPSLFATAALAQFMAANVATSAYVMLTVANARLITHFGSEAQIETFAMPEIAGRTFGTMCLSEPQAGSSLADVQTRAEPDGEDVLGPRYRLTGNKMWISGGDQDITENIVHLVLAKIPGADGRLPEGTQGVSLFIVPKLLSRDGTHNDVVVAGLNHKMGYRGTANCLLNLGEGIYRPEGRAGAIGYRVGAEGQGLHQMFQMMNEARIHVGLGAAALAYRGFRQSLAYSRERVQGRLADAARVPGSAPVAIIEHADVKRMLLAQKAYAEGALALVLYCAKLVDAPPDDTDTAELLALLTPVAKTWPSEWGLAANDLAIQILGGYGYTRDFDLEQLWRDNRLNPIHEGTTAIQAIDLLGRKLLREGAHGLDVLGRRVLATIARAKQHRDLAQHADALQDSWGRVGDTLSAVSTRRERRLDHATAFLWAFGHIVVAWLWLDQALVCIAAAAQDPFLTGKLRACSYFFEAELPKAGLWLGAVRSGSNTAAGTSPAEF